MNTNMDINKEEYKKLVQNTAKKSPIIKNCIFAFIFGGAICTLGQALFDLYGAITDYSADDRYALVSITVIFITALLTGLGIFDNIAKYAGAGTLVPVTGFANSVVSPAIDTKAEGLVLGVGAKIFTVAGPVILYAVLSGTLYGVILWVIKIL